MGERESGGEGEGGREREREIIHVCEKGGWVIICMHTHTKWIMD